MYRVNMIHESIRSKIQYMINIHIVFKIEYYIYKRVHSVLYYKLGQYKMDQYLNYTQYFISLYVCLIVYHYNSR